MPCEKVNILFMRVFFISLLQDNILSALQRFCHQRTSWAILFASGLALELAALYFQYVLKFDPCVMCIYIRVAVLGIMLSALVGLVMPKFWLVRLLGMRPQPPHSFSHQKQT